MTTIDRLDQIEARANAATEGPWSIPAWDDCSVMPSAWADEELPPEERGEFAHISTTSDTDAEFIAHARSDMPALVDALRAALEEIGSIQQASDTIAINPRPGGKVLAGERWRIAEQIRIVIEEALS